MTDNNSQEKRVFEGKAQHRRGADAVDIMDEGKRKSLVILSFPGSIRMMNGRQWRVTVEPLPAPSNAGTVAGGPIVLSDKAMDALRICAACRKKLEKRREKAPAPRSSSNGQGGAP